MSATVSDFIVERLARWGVKRVFGYPGDGILGVVGALGRADDFPRFIQVRHEEMAAFAACAHSKFTGEVGVCMATSGPGAIHLLNGLYDAKKDHVPVVAIVGQSALSDLGSDYQQEVDLPALFKDVAHEFVQQAGSAHAVRHLVDRAFRIALGRRAVTCLILPKDLQEEKYSPPSSERHSSATGIGWSSPRVVPKEADLKQAAEVLNSGERVAMLIGAGALRAGDEVVEVADLLGAGVAKALLGKAALPDDLRFVTGSIGLLGTKPSWDLMQECDTLLMVGTSFPYREFLPAEGQARGVQIDLEPRMLSLRYPMEVNLAGDARETLQALIPHLKRKTDRAWRRKIEEGVASWWQVLEDRAHMSAKPLNPQRLFWELSPRLPDNCILTSDSGSAANWYARDLKIRKGMMASLSGGLATMGPAMPYAVGAKFAYPDRCVIALAGDGAMQMNGLNELITVEKYWKTWSDPRFVVLVLNNGDLNQVTWEQRAMSGDPKFPPSQVLPDFSYAEYAESLGLVGLRVDSPDDVGSVWDKALSSRRPVLIEAMVDPEVPPLPPHITAEQASSLMRAVVGGDPNTVRLIIQSIKQAMPSVLPMLRRH